MDIIAEALRELKSLESEKSNSKKLNEQFSVKEDYDATKTTPEEIVAFITKVGLEAIENAVNELKNNQPVVEPETAEETSLVVEPVAAEEESVSVDTPEEVETEEAEEEAPVDECVNECNETVEECKDCTESVAVDEAVADSMPATPLDINAVRDFIVNLPEPSPNVPPRFFKLGYIRELVNEIPTKYRGGRNSEGQPYVRIFKCTEYSALYTGSNWRDTNATKAADKILGTERHTGEKTGFNFNDENSIPNRIGKYANGQEALQAYIADQSRQKVKWFISLDDEDLREVTRAEVAQYLTPSVASRVLTPERVAAGQDSEGNNIYDKPINRFYLSKIYMIGNLGRSVM